MSVPSTKAKASLKPLDPPDLKRCQVEITETLGPFRMGGPPVKTERCKNKPIVVAIEKEPGDDGRKGSMSICARCLGEAFELFKRNAAPAMEFRAVADVLLDSK